MTISVRRTEMIRAFREVGFSRLRNSLLPIHCIQLAQDLAEMEIDSAGFDTSFQTSLVVEIAA